MELNARTLLGLRLRKFRKDNGYSQSHIANVLGIERSTYTYYEIGKTIPVVFDLMRLADLYSISMDELLGFHADSSDPLAFGEPRQPVKAVVRRQERYPREVMQDLSTEERQLIAYFRSTKPADRRQFFEHLRTCRRRESRRNTTV